MPAGLVQVVPTSVTKTGTGSTATIGTNGTVTLTSCVTATLNGLFSSTYDHYRLVIRGTSSPGADAISMRLTTGGTQASSAVYAEQQYYVDGTSVTGTRSTALAQANFMSVSSSSAGPSGTVLDIFGPALAQATQWRTLGVHAGAANLTVAQYEYAGSHASATSYDGLWFEMVLGNGLTAKISVYGWNK